LECFESLKNDLDWERRVNTPRCEYYINDYNEPYTYGVGNGQRTYLSKPSHPLINVIKNKIELQYGCKFEACFLNKYLDQKDHLGWHADDSPEMDNARPIVIISLGVEREIWFRKLLTKVCVVCQQTEEQHSQPCPSTVKKQYISLYSEEQKNKLASGSCCVMLPNMQLEWQHRIPKSSSKIGERISLTFRGFIQ
jgi:alkylated DNA repair dioxygenase AlkB